MDRSEQMKKLESWLDSYLNFERTPRKNIFWLDTMRFLCGKFGHPELSAPCFHVAGSKGKGSVSAFIASILDAAGLRTGLYTSPHILDFTERVSSVRGLFDDAVYGEAAAEIMDGVRSVGRDEFPGGRDVTWFELVTLFAFLVFRRAGVDYSVFEVGLGGRLDSTNIVSPVCSCITPVELEHTEFLGGTIEKIAFEKGGIIKERTPVVIARQQKSAADTLLAVASEKRAPVILADEAIKGLEYKISPLGKCAEEPGTPLMTVSFSADVFSRPVKTSLRMHGKFQAENAALAALAVKTAVPAVTEEQIERGLAAAALPARFEIIRNPKGFGEIPYLVLDGAHTVNSVSLTMETMRSALGESGHTLLFACAADKDAPAIAPLFRGCFERIFLTRPGDAKQSDLAALTRAFDNAGLPYDCSADYKAQILKALGSARERRSALLVTGSFYLIAEVMRILRAL